ncbi:MAG TPA: serine/threonine-protein kinase [Prosthecobacter sp.]
MLYGLRFVFTFPSIISIMTEDTLPISRQKEVFLAARDIADAEERARFLADSCGGDDSLRARVESMLIADAREDTFLTPLAEAAESAASPALGEKVGYFGDYMLLDEIARGAMGVVYRARQVSLDRIVALKMLRETAYLAGEDGMRRLRAEATAAASLDHPNILPIYEVGVHEGQWYFSMKLIKGGTLQFRLAEYQADARKAVALMAKVARAVQCAHEQGILHRDLKPGNILVDSRGEPHITDFGLARRIGGDGSLSMNGQILGTPHYMAPEQARGVVKDLTPAADIYSLGAMLYELLAGRRAFAGEDIIALLKQVAEAEPPPLPATVDPALAAIVMKAMAKSPAERHATAGQLADEMEAWLRGDEMAPHAQARPKPRWLAWAWKAALAAVVIAWVGQALSSHDASREIVRVTTLQDELDARSADGTGISLREALRDAPEKGRVHFGMPGKITLSGALGGIEIGKNVEVVGGDGVQIHAGADVARTFVIMDGATVTLSGLVLSGESTAAYRRGSVGAIENSGTLNVIECRFLNNGGGGNGGAITSHGSLVLRRCHFDGNSCHSVGGAVNIERAEGPVFVEDCVFTGNQAHGKGGGAFHVALFAFDADITLSHCTFVDNGCTPSPTRRRGPFSGEGEGGALRIQTGRVRLEHCLIAGNHGPVAGTENIAGTYEETGSNFIGADPKDAPAGMGARQR